MRWPDFLGIGAAKSGTSSLYHYLNQHPQIFMCPVHEPNFFALEGGRDAGQFRGPGDWETVERFCLRDRAQYLATFANAPREQVTGEISPLYLYSPHAPINIRATCPDIKLIALLRHPVERAISNYRQYRKAGIEPLGSFQQALEAEETRLRQGWGPWPFWHYQRVGFYGVQIRRYLDCFPREQLFVGLYEELSTNPTGLLQKMFAFLEVEAAFVPDVRVRHNLSAQPKSPAIHALATRPNWFKDTVKHLFPTPLRQRLRDALHQWNTREEVFPLELREKLMALYRDDILLLQDLLQQDLSSWLKTTP